LNAIAGKQSTGARLKLVTTEGDRTEPPLHLQRAQGEVSVGFKQVSGTTRLAELYQQGCMKARLPRQTGTGHEAVLINTSGGLTGGDDIRLRGHWAKGAGAVITTQACERIYKSVSGPAAVVGSLVVDDGAFARWLPQETILFNEANLNRSMQVSLKGSARLLACEAVILGRPAMGEYVHKASFRDEWTINRDGRLIFVDRLGLDGDISAELNRRAVGNGARCFATMIAAGDGFASKCDAVRDRLAATGLHFGISDLGDVVLLRLLAPNSHGMRAALLPILELMADQPLPRVWRT
jgi:urease accessory protein